MTAPKSEAFPEAPKAGPALEKREAAPGEAEPAEPKRAPKKKPAATKPQEPEKEPSEQPAQKDPMKSDLMKDEKPSYYDDPNWAKKGKTTVRIVIPGWHKKKADSSEEKPEDSDKTKSGTPKKDSKTESAPDEPAPEK
jgi:hypothetical protein